MPIDSTTESQVMPAATEEELEVLAEAQATVTSSDAGAATRTKYWSNTWKEAPSYKEVKYGAPKVGRLKKGKNYFWGQRWFPVTQVDKDPRGKDIKSNWWALTDDDNHNPNVWVSCLYIVGGENGQEIKGIGKV